MDLQVAVIGIGLAREQRLELAPRHLGLEGAQRLLGLVDDRLILLGLAELDHADIVLEVALDPPDGGELILEVGAFLHQALGALIVVPQIGIFGEGVQLLEPPACLVEVKDASSAVPRTA
jgi:hypothetical protein